MRSLLDPGQIIKTVFDETSEAIKVAPITGTFITSEFDQIILTYVASGDGVGEVESATYKLAGNTVGVLLLSYDSSNRLTSVTRS